MSNSIKQTKELLRRLNGSYGIVNEENKLTQDRVDIGIRSLIEALARYGATPAYRIIGDRRQPFEIVTGRDGSVELWQTAILFDNGQVGVIYCLVKDNETQVLTYDPKYRAGTDVVLYIPEVDPQIIADDRRVVEKIAYADYTPSDD